MANSLLARRTDFQRALLTWYRANARRLPWREAPSVYKTVVSEFMLQQTQVKTVLPYFAHWLEELPDFAALANASEARVLKLWEGLGYYSRARNLHRLAREIVARPHLPNLPDEWRELPGIGPYTAAAITSISFGAPAACVDGNVVRILARLTADSTSFRDSASAAKAFTFLANDLVSVDSPGDHNQAMMELGATVCTKHNPLCLTCPVRTFCVAGQRGEPDEFPRLMPKQIEQRRVVRLWCQRDDSLLLHRAASTSRRLADLHELPTPEHVGLDASEFSEQVQLLQKRRSITRFQITETVYAARAPKKINSAELSWVKLSDLPAITLSGPHRRWVTELLAKSADSG